MTNPTPQHKDTTLDDLLEYLEAEATHSDSNAWVTEESKVKLKQALLSWRDKAVVEASKDKLWYIVDDFGGNIKKGGFETAELALEFRQYYEQATKRTYAIEQRKPQLKETPNED